MLLKYTSVVILIILGSIHLIGCKKENFEHSEEEIIPESCACCELSDTIEGIYTGRLLEFTNIGSVPGPIILDTLVDSIVTINITRIETNTFEDSLICSFNVPVFFSEPILLTDNSGSFHSASFWQYYSKYFATEFPNSGALTINLEKRQSVYQSGTYTSMRYIGIKQ